MIGVLKLNWKLYFIEAWALGMFMISAILFTILLEHPFFYFKTAIASALERRFFIGLGMGGTAVFLIYSGWGKKSGAHMNPAVTLTFLLLKRISRVDAFFYIVAQFIGGLCGVLLMLLLFPRFVQDASVNYVVTIPAGNGFAAAFIYEFLMSFILIEVILIAGNSALKKYTGYFAGLLLVIYISFEAPFSGMSINPARTIASALPAKEFTALWIYFIAPVGGMLLAGLLYRSIYNWRKGNCLNMMLHVKGNCEENESYLPEI